MTDKELISIVDAKAKKLWNKINTGHEYSIIDSYNQFYGICMEIAEIAQKEITMILEEKAKAYDEALKAAIVAHKDEDKHLKATLERIFPKLKESEEERIRKELIEFVKSRGGFKQEYIAWLEKQGEQMSDPRYNILDKLIEADSIYQMAMNDAMVEEAKTKAIDALSKLEIGNLLKIEKQGDTNETLCDKCKKAQPSHSCQDITELGRCAVEHEQKPTYKVESKFHEGDWIVDKNGTVQQILSYKDGVYKRTDGYSAKIFEDEWRLWDITKDAKDGDVLFCKGNIKNSNEIKYERICLFNNLDKAFFTLTKTSNYVEEYDIDVNIDYPDNTVPATKKQKEILFMAMKEAGYEWDAEKKELRKMSQRMISAEAKEAMYDKPAEDKVLQCPHFINHGGMSHECMLGYSPANCEACSHPDKHYVKICTTTNTSGLNRKAFK